MCITYGEVECIVRVLDLILVDIGLVLELKSGLLGGEEHVGLGLGRVLQRHLELGASLALLLSDRLILAVHLLMAHAGDVLSTIDLRQVHGVVGELRLARLELKLRVRLVHF